MQDNIRVLFSLIEDYLTSIGHKDHKNAKMGSEVILVAYIAMRDFNGTYKKALRYAIDMKLTQVLSYIANPERVGYKKDIKR